MSRNEKGMDTETRLRTMRILWAVFLMTVGMYALVAYFAAPGAPDAASAWADDSLGSIGASAGGLSMLLVVFFVIGLSAVVASFLVKQAFANRAVREQNPAVLQTGLIVALALCEMAGLLGIVGLFSDGNRAAYLLFVVSAAGIVLHFPRREDLNAASGGETGFGIGIN